jgi:release factor glutamine methyltransferase
MYMRKKIFKKILHAFYKPLVERHLRKERNYVHDGLRLKIFPGVFHPGFFFSTKILLSYMKKFDLKNKTLLELGAGSGLISLVAAKKGALVTASDINAKAVKNIFLNKELNGLATEVIHSDLFQNIPKKFFDFIIINPPYYKGKIMRDDDYAWHAGEQLEYFQKLFQQLSAFIHEKTKVIMVLSDECDIGQIQFIASQKQFKFIQSFTKKMFRETNFIFEIEK